MSINNPEQRTSVTPDALPQHIQRVDDAFDKTSMDQAHTQELLDKQVPDYAQDVIDQADPNAANFLEHPAVETSSNVRRNVILGTTGFLLTGLVAGGLVLANQPKNTTPEATPSATSVPNPGQTETTPPTHQPTSEASNPANTIPLQTAPVKTPEITPAPVKPETKAPEVMPVSLERFKNMTPAEFAKTTKLQQLTYWSWQSRNMKAFADEWYEATENPRDKLPVASENNTAQEIDTIMRYNLAFIYSIEGDAERTKALNAVLHSSQDSSAYPIWVKEYPLIPIDSLNVKLLATNAFVPSGDVVNAGPRGTERGDVYQDVKTLSNGHVVREYYMHYTDAAGNPATTWIRE